MNKAELIALMAKEAEISKAKAGAALDAMVGGITKSLKKGEDVQLIGFGSFRVKKRKARMGRNPQTGKTIKIAAKKVPAFAAGAALKKAVAKK